MVLEQELARAHYKVGWLMMDSLQPAKFQEAETHFKQALHLHRKVEASCCMHRGAVTWAANKAADEGLYATLDNLGDFYGFMRKNDDELQVYQEALDEVRGDITQASTPQLEMHLSNILSDIFKM